MSTGLVERQVSAGSALSIAGTRAIGQNNGDPLQLLSPQSHSGKGSSHLKNMEKGYGLYEPCDAPVPGARVEVPRAPPEAGSGVSGMSGPASCGQYMK